MVNCLNIENSKYIKEIKIETGERLSLIKVFGYQQQIKDLFEKENKSILLLIMKTIMFF